MAPVLQWGAMPFCTTRMSTIIEIRIAELFVGNQSYTMVSNGIGSCIVIIFYDRLTGLGGMAHAILPHAKNSPDRTTPFAPDSEGRFFAKYADQAVDILLEKIEELGGVREHLVAKLVGGAHMFALLEGDQYGVGFENTEAARKRISELGITIEKEVVGGTVGRNVRFDCRTGIVEITTRV